MDIKEFHSKNIYFAEDYFRNHNELPTTVFVATEQNVLVLHAPFENDKQKAQVFDFYALILKISKAKYYTFASESWMYITDKLPTVKPSQHPDRKTVLTFLTIDRNKNIIPSLFEVQRNLLIPFDCNEYSQIESEATELFDRDDFDKAIIDRIDTLWNIKKPMWVTEVDYSEYDVKVDS